jgi:capsular polysaccharide transport system permease protein
MTNAKNDERSVTKGKVLTLGNSAAIDPSDRQERRRPSRLLVSFLLCVVLPLFAAMLYYATFATDRYAARAGFSIRGIDTNAGIDGIGALTGLASTGSTTSDSYIVLSYLGSRELLEAVDFELDLRGVYSSRDVDPLSRLDADATVEDFLKYWNRRIHTRPLGSSSLRFNPLARNMRKKSQQRFCALPKPW